MKRLKTYKQLNESTEELDLSLKDFSLSKYIMRMGYDDIKKYFEDGGEINEDSLYDVIHSVSDKVRNYYKEEIDTDYSTYKKIIELLIDNGLDVNFKSSFRKSPLIILITFLNKDMSIKNEGDLIKIIKFLIDSGIDINYIDKQKSMSILKQAIIVNSSEIVDYLIEKDVNINAKLENDKTALYSSFNNEKIMKKLIDNGGDVNILDNENVNLLFNYINSGTIFNRKILNLILDNTTNIDLKNNYGWNILLIASNYNTDYILDILKKNPEWNVIVDYESKNLNFIEFLEQVYVGKKQIIPKIKELYPEKYDEIMKDILMRRNMDKYKI